MNETAAEAGSPPPQQGSVAPTDLSFLIIPWDPGLLLIRAPGILRGGSIRGGQKLVSVLVLRAAGSINSSSPRDSPCHLPSRMEPQGSKEHFPRGPPSPYSSLFLPVGLPAFSEYFCDRAAVAGTGVCPATG